MSKCMLLDQNMVMPKPESRRPWMAKCSTIRIARKFDFRSFLLQAKRKLQGELCWDSANLCAGLICFKCKKVIWLFPLFVMSMDGPLSRTAGE